MATSPVQDAQLNDRTKGFVISERFQTVCNENTFKVSVVPAVAFQLGSGAQVTCCIRSELAVTNEIISPPITHISGETLIVRETSLPPDYPTRKFLSSKSTSQDDGNTISYHVPLESRQDHGGAAKGSGKQGLDGCTTCANETPDSISINKYKLNANLENATSYSKEVPEVLHIDIDKTEKIADGSHTYLKEESTRMDSGSRSQKLFALGSSIPPPAMFLFYPLKYNYFSALIRSLAILIFVLLVLAVTMLYPSRMTSSFSSFHGKNIQILSSLSSLSEQSKWHNWVELPRSVRELGTKSSVGEKSLRKIRRHPPTADFLVYSSPPIRPQTASANIQEVSTAGGSSLSTDYFKPSVQIMVPMIVTEIQSPPPPSPKSPKVRKPPKSPKPQKAPKPPKSPISTPFSPQPPPSPAPPAPIPPITTPPTIIRLNPPSLSNSTYTALPPPANRNNTPSASPVPLGAGSPPLSPGGASNPPPPLSSGSSPPIPAGGGSRPPPPTLPRYLSPPQPPRGSVYGSPPPPPLGSSRPPSPTSPSYSNSPPPPSGRNSTPPPPPPVSSSQQPPPTPPPPPSRPTPPPPPGDGSGSGAVYEVTLFGAAGNGVKDDTDAVSRTFSAACSYARLGNKYVTVLFPKGATFLIFPIQIIGPCGAGMKVQIDGSIIAPTDASKYPKPASYDQWANLYFLRLPSLTITGSGSIDGRGYASFWKMKTNNRPLNLLINACDDFTITNVRLLNPGKQSLKVRNSMNVFVSNMTIISGPPDSPNTDCTGFSNVRNAVIRDSYFECGDDNVAIVGSSSNITVLNIQAVSGHGISIGSLGALGATACVSDIFVKNITMNGADNGARIKTYQGGSGVVRNVIFQDMTFINVKRPILIDQYYCDMDESKCGAKSLAVVIKDVVFKNIAGTSRGVAAMEFLCSGTSPCTNISLENINIKSGTNKVLRNSFFSVYGKSTNMVAPTITGTTWSQGAPTDSQMKNLVASSSKCGNPGPFKV